MGPQQRILAGRRSIESRQPCEFRGFQGSKDCPQTVCAFGMAGRCRMVQAGGMADQRCGHGILVLQTSSNAFDLLKIAAATRNPRKAGWQLNDSKLTSL
jgi:hypothetical protein